jgi:hypothetical protein
LERGVWSLDPVVAAASRSRREFGVLVRALRSSTTCPPRCASRVVAAAAAQRRNRGPDRCGSCVLGYAVGPQPTSCPVARAGDLARCRLRSHSEEAGWRFAEQLCRRPLGWCIGQWKDSPAPWRGYRAVELECACWRVARREVARTPGARWC